MKTETDMLRDAIDRMLSMVDGRRTDLTPLQRVDAIRAIGIKALSNAAPPTSDIRIYTYKEV